MLLLLLNWTIAMLFNMVFLAPHYHVCKESKISQLGLFRASVNSFTYFSFLKTTLVTCAFPLSIQNFVTYVYSVQYIHGKNGK